MYKKILVPTDGSEAAEKEVEKVGDLLAEDGEIIILSVASELTPHQFQSKEDIDKLNQSFLDEAQFNVDTEHYPCRACSGHVATCGQ